MNKQILPAIFCAIAALCSISTAHAANPDVTGLEPTIRQPDLNHMIRSLPAETAYSDLQRL